MSSRSPGLTGDAPSPRTPFFERLSAEAQRDFLKAGTKRRYPVGSTLFFEGEEAHETLLTVAGFTKTYMVASDGREVILSVIGPGSLMGEIAVLDGGTRSASAMALTELDMVAIQADGFHALLRDHPEVLSLLAVQMAEMVRDNSLRQLHFGTGDSLGRVCIRLLELADRFGHRQADGTITIESPLNQADLGSWSGLSREAIVKSFRTMRQLGWIENSGRSITLLLPDEIVARASS